MATYVDGFVIPLKKRNLKAYKKLASVACKVWLKYGALSYYECVGDDLNVNFGWTFPKMCKLKKDETVIFAFIVYKSKAQRDQINKKIHTDPVMEKMCGKDGKMPFEMKRFAMAGFKTIVQSK